jgi:DNA-binding XRE family transcriptional regulator
MLGFYARNLRMHLELTQKELAKLAQVSSKAVDMFENNQPLPLEEKRKILTQLYAEKARKLSCH